MSQPTNTFCIRNAMTDGISSFDVITGVHVRRIHPQVITEPPDSAATFPQPLPDTQTVLLEVMRGGIALAITVAIPLEVPPPVPNVQD